MTQGPSPTTETDAPAAPAAGNEPLAGPGDAPKRPRGRIIRRDRSNPPPQALPDEPHSRTMRSSALNAGYRARSEAEKLMIRIVAIAGIIGISAAIAAIMQSSGSAGWLIGVVIAAVSVALTSVLWTSKRL